MFSSLSNVLDSAPVRYQKRLRKGLESFSIIERDFYNQIYECPVCDTLYTHLYFEVYDFETGEEIISEYSCDECQTRLIPATKDLGDYTCKRCGSKGQFEDHEILWD